MNIGSSWGRLGGALVVVITAFAANAQTGSSGALSTQVSTVEVPFGDLANGERLFHSARACCSDCHAVSADETSYYPNLSSVGRRLNHDQLLTAITEPSAELAIGFKAVSVLTASGRIIRGTEIESQSDAELLVLADDSGKRVSIRREDIDELQIAESPMPSNLSEVLSTREIADIVAYLESLDETAFGAE